MRKKLKTIHYLKSSIHAFHCLHIYFYQYFPSLAQREAAQVPRQNTAMSTMKLELIILINVINMKTLSTNTIVNPRGEQINVSLIEAFEAIPMAKAALSAYDISVVDYTVRDAFILQTGEILDFFYVTSDAHLFKNEEDLKKCYEKGVFRLLVKYFNDFSLKYFHFYVTPAWVQPLQSLLEYIHGYSCDSYELFKVNNSYLYLRGKWKTSGYWFPNWEMFIAYYNDFLKISSEIEEDKT